MISVSESNQWEIILNLSILGIIVCSIELIADIRYVLYHGISLLNVIGVVVGTLGIYISYQGYINYKSYKSTLPKI